MIHQPRRLRLAGALLAAIVAAAPAAEARPGQDGAAAPGRTQLGSGPAAPAPDVHFEHMLQRFHTTYKVGPEDEIAIRVVGEPDYTLERAKVSPFGAVYHPLLGDVEVAGLTVPQVTDKLRDELTEYIISPRVSVSLVEARSAKVGVLGDVTKPGILLMERPMTVLDAISASGGFTDFGKSTDVTVLRQLGAGQTRTISVNVKRILEGKADPYENFALQPGDTIVVHGNKKKTLAMITSLTGFATFLTFVGR